MRMHLTLGAIGSATLLATALTLTPADSALAIDDHGPQAGPKAPLALGGGFDVATSRVGLESSGDVDDIHFWGSTGGGFGTRAYSIATTSCNLGDETGEWISGDGGFHPVIAQNIFRFWNGRFEHVGQSWLKHSFCAVNESTCGTCQGTSCNSLGIGCADTYWATLNDGQDGGAKSDISPFTMGFTHSHPFTEPTGLDTIRGRLQIAELDVIAGAEYFIEAQYVTHDEPLANRHNNASWRHVFFQGDDLIGEEGGQDSVHIGEPAILAWEDFDPNAVVTEIEVPSEGAHVFVGYSVTDNGDGTWHYEYGVQNLNSDKSIGSFEILIPDDVSVSNIGFHDVSYHSGEPYSSDDWNDSLNLGVLRWNTQSHLSNPDANAIRWGTLYNFRFDADTPPVATTAELGVFKPHSVLSYDAPILGPGGGSDCFGDLNGDGAVNIDDLLVVLAAFGTPCDGCPADADGDGDVDIDDLLTVLAGWGPCG